MIPALSARRERSNQIRQMAEEHSVVSSTGSNHGSIGESSYTATTDLNNQVENTPYHVLTTPTKDSGNRVHFRRETTEQSFVLASNLESTEVGSATPNIGLPRTQNSRVVSASRFTSLLHTGLGYLGVDDAEVGIFEYIRKIKEKLGDVEPLQEIERLQVAASSHEATIAKHKSTIAKYEATIAEHEATKRTALSRISTLRTQVDTLEQSQEELLARASVAGEPLYAMDRNEQPGVALAKLLHNANNQLKYAKDDFKQVSKEYVESDIMLDEKASSKRRHVLYQKMQAVDHYREQVTRLHIVVQGFKDAGGVITNQQFDDTLSSLGFIQEKIDDSTFISRRM